MMADLSYSLAFDLIGSRPLKDAKDIGLLTSNPDHAVQIAYRLLPHQSLYAQEVSGIDPSIIHTPSQTVLAWVPSFQVCPSLDVLVWLEPDQSHPSLLKSYLVKNEKSSRVVILSTSWLGRRLLAGWRKPGSNLGQRPIGTASAINVLKSADMVVRTEYAIQGIHSLGWGWLAHTAERLGRPDLSDRWFAVLRQHTYLSALPRDLCLLHIIVAERSV